MIKSNRWRFLAFVIIVFSTFPRITAEPGLRTKAGFREEIKEEELIPQNNNNAPRIRMITKDENLINLEDGPEIVAVIKISSKELAARQQKRQAPKKPLKIPNPDLVDIYHRSCESTADCVNSDSHGMECKDNKCECTSYEDQMLKYHDAAKKCLGANGHSCSHNYMCYSRECVKIVSGNYDDIENSTGRCSSAKRTNQHPSTILTIFLFLSGAMALTKIFNPSS